MSCSSTEPDKTLDSPAFSALKPKNINDDCSGKVRTIICVSNFLLVFLPCSGTLYSSRVRLSFFIAPTSFIYGLALTHPISFLYIPLLSDIFMHFYLFILSSSPSDYSVLEVPTCILYLFYISNHFSLSNLLWRIIIIIFFFIFLQIFYQMLFSLSHLTATY